MNIRLPALSATLGLAALALGAACTEKGEGLVLVQLSSSQTIVRASVVVASPADASVLGVGTANWPVTQPLQLGVYVAKSVSGSVDVVACGFDAAGNLIASSPDNRGTYTTVVQPGATTAPVPITLLPGYNPALCSALAGAGGHGGGAATGGASGAAGAATGGAGGAAGTPGTGGTAGGGGKGGAAGTPGTGGMAGAGGAKGGAGGGGSGGKGGTGGGTAGAAGSGTWHGAVSVAQDATNGAQYPSVAVDGSGNAVVVYEDGNQIWSAYYGASTATWSAPGPVDSRGSVYSKPSVAVDKNGKYLAVWALQIDSSLQGIWQSTSTDGKTWSKPISISQNWDMSPVLAMNADGAAVVAWDQELSDGSNTVQADAAIRSATDGTWSAPVVMRAGDTGDDSDRDPTVAIDGKGNAFVGWMQGDGSGSTSASSNLDSLWMRQYTAGAGWNAAGLFESYNDQGCYDLRISANTSGNAIATYIQVSNSNPAKIQIWARRYSALSSTFDTNPSMVTQANNIENIFAPSVTLDESSNATVAWAAQTSIGYNVYTSRAAPTDPAWPTGPMAMETDDVAMNDITGDVIARVTDPIVRNDPAGNVTLVWRKRFSGTRFNLVSRSYSAATGNWSAQVPLENNTTNDVLWPTLAVGSNGTAVTAWYFDTIDEVWAAVFN